MICATEFWSKLLKVKSKGQFWISLLSGGSNDAIHMKIQEEREENVLWNMWNVS